MTHNVRRGGIPVLAYTASDAASPVLLSLVFKCNESPAQATLSVQTTLPVYGVDDTQTITLQYDADNLASCSLGPATIPLPQLRLDEITRKGNPQIRTLSLNLKQACSVWHLPTSGPLAARAGFETLFDQLASLAKATKLHILFDYHWLHRETHAIFEHLVKHPEDLSAFPVDRNFAKKYTCADWSIFSTPGDEHSYATSEDEDPLPSYVEASTKRVRQVSISPTSSPRTTKRVLLSPFPEHAPTSPTEKGSVATPSPRPWELPNLSSPEAREFLGQALATLSPTKKPNPTASGPEPSSSTAVPAVDFHRAVEKAASTIFPTMMGNFLPSALPHLLAVASPPAPSSPGSPTPNPPPPTALSSLGNLLGAHITRQVETQLQSIHNHTLSHAAWLRNTADDEFSDMLEERRVDLVMTKEDALDEMDRAVTTKREDFHGQIEEVAEDFLSTLANSADQVCDNAKQRLDDYAREEQARIQRERGWLGWEREVLERDKKKLEEAKTALERKTADQRSRRAGSAPA